MKTGLDMVQDVYNTIIADEIKAAMLLTGSIYKLIRPINTTLEDVVINSLAASNEQIQEGVVNVNVHIPNLVIASSSGSDNTQPNFKRLNEVGKLLFEKLKFFAGYDFKLYAQNAGYPIQDEDGSWYLNIRVVYNSFQNNFKI